eukprot:759261-Hanusia_phi.AAC.1
MVTKPDIILGKYNRESLFRVLELKSWCEFETDRGDEMEGGNGGKRRSDGGMEGGRGRTERQKSRKQDQGGDQGVEEKDQEMAIRD